MKAPSTIRLQRPIVKRRRTRNYTVARYFRLCATLRHSLHEQLPPSTLQRKAREAILLPMRSESGSSNVFDKSRIFHSSWLAAGFLQIQSAADALRNSLRWVD